MCVHASEKVMRALPAFIRLWIGSLCAHALQFLHLHYAWFVRGLCICAKLVQTRALLSCCLCEYFLGFWESCFVVFFVVFLTHN